MLSPIKRLQINSPKYGSFIVLLDQEDFDRLSPLRVSIHNNDGDFYPRTKKTGLHRLIIKDKKDFVIDHINGNLLDNRKCNLRYLTRQENVFNRHKQSISKTKVLGVSSHLGKYDAHIKYNYKKIHLGRFDTIKQAKQARKKAEIKYWGYNLQI